MSWCQLLCFVLAKYCLRNEQARAGLMMMHHGFIYFFSRGIQTGGKPASRCPSNVAKGKEKTETRGHKLSKYTKEAYTMQ